MELQTINSPSILKLAAMQVTAGGSAGFVEVCIMHPLDLVKTRLQIQNKKSASPNAVISSTETANDLYFYQKYSMLVYVGLLQRCFRLLWKDVQTRRAAVLLEGYLTANSG